MPADQRPVAGEPELPPCQIHDEDRVGPCPRTWPAHRAVHLPCRVSHRLEVPRRRELRCPSYRPSLDPRPSVRVRHLLRVRTVWAIPWLWRPWSWPVMTALYIASVVDPPAHLRALPVAVVNQDEGATAGSQYLEVRRQMQAGLLASPAMSGLLHLVVSTLPKASGPWAATACTRRW